MGLALGGVGLLLLVAVGLSMSSVFDDISAEIEAAQEEAEAQQQAAMEEEEQAQVEIVPLEEYLRQNSEAGLL